MFRAPLIVALLAIASPAQAAAVLTNLVTNGSFEQFTSSLNSNRYRTITALPGWTITNTQIGSGPGLGPEAFVTDGTTSNAFGDRVVAANATTPYPDADRSGLNAIYFVDDNALQRLSQSIYLAAGTYEVGFDILAVPSGFGNQTNPTFTASIAGTTITSATVSSLSRGVWTHFAANVTIGASAIYDYSVVYNSIGPGTAKDIIVDNFYVFTPSTIAGPGTYVPEPASLALFGAGIAALAAGRARITPRRR